MNYGVFDSLSKQHESMIASLQKFNKLAVSNAEKITTLQMGALRSYSEFGLQNLKQLSQIKNPSLLQDYLNNQGKALRTLSERALADSKAITDLSVEFNQELQNIARESFEVAATKAA